MPLGKALNTLSLVCHQQSQETHPAVRMRQLPLHAEPGLFKVASRQVRVPNDILGKRGSLAGRVWAFWKSTVLIIGSTAEAVAKSGKEFCVAVLSKHCLYLLVAIP